jgi:hypothetical protein
LSIDSYSKASLHTDEEEKHSSSGTIEKSSKSGGVSDEKSLTDAIYRKYGLKSPAEAQKKYLELKQERRELRTKLDDF